MNGNLSDPDLWSRIAAYEFPSVDGMLFGDYVRLKTGYNARDVNAMIFEYRRFTYLCIACPGETRPSTYVDEIWHIHLTLTADYWNRFCPEALGRKLHHNPGGPPPNESPRFEATLEQYEQEFGKSAPDRYWRPAPSRFILRGLQIGFLIFATVVSSVGWPKTALLALVPIVLIQIWIRRQRPQKAGGDSGGVGCGGGCGD